MRRAKIVIVGGGPAGLAAALALAERGRASDVVVLEKATYPREKPCAGAVSARGLKVLDALGAGVERLDVPRVVVLEKATYPREKPCAGAVSARGLKVLDAL
ncbi:MAG TPA: FAD-dependent oxidoreductase, partial [Polyangiaceae bacterium]|nr:FAD-dependent oxidoreductase [Polyangiaceae bacterium]